MNIPIIILPKKELYPAFGKANLKTSTVYIREDIAGSMAYRFVLCHEMYHIKDRTRAWALGEIKANVYAGVRHPVGFFIILFRSVFSVDRWKLYFKLLRKEARNGSDRL